MRPKVGKDGIEAGAAAAAAGSALHSWAKAGLPVAPRPSGCVIWGHLNHPVKSGQLWSRSEMTAGCGTGQAMANAGSFHRTPRAD